MSPPITGQSFLRDTELRGFAVRATPTGQKSFVLEKRIEGRVRRMTLGRYGELTVAQARSQAQQLLGRIAMGEDPIATKRRERARALSLGDAYLDYLSACKSLRPKTRMDYDRAINVVFADWKNRPLHTITQGMVAKRHCDLAKTRGEQGANNYMRVLRAVFAFAIDRYDDDTGKEIISHNPVLVLTKTRSWFRMERRQTVIKLHQMPSWYQAVESLRDIEHHKALGDTVADFLLFLLLTGLRRNEAATLLWSEVDLVDRVFTIKETKNHRPHTLPIADFVFELLQRRLGATTGRYVFAGRAGKGRLVEPKRQIRHVVETAGIAFTLHDLRRTFITVAELINLSPYTIKRLANHSTRGDVTAGYIISDIERLRTPIREIEKHLVSAMNITGHSNVVALRPDIASSSEKSFDYIGKVEKRIHNSD